MYGFPKDIELERMKSPFFTYLDFSAPSFVILFSVFILPLVSWLEKLNEINI
jgi:hypothetical protein